MEMLVTKFSNGKYRNEGDLFSEPISAENVRLMGEMIALQALRTHKKFDMKVADKLYIGLIKDLHHMGEIDYIVSDGYDVAQTAICFLYQFIGRTVNEIYGKDRKGKEIAIKLACYREIDRELMRLRQKAERTKSIDFTDYKALPMDPVNCFEQEQTDYSKYDELVDALRLSALELAILNCYMNGMVQSSKHPPEILRHLRRILIECTFHTNKYRRRPVTYNKTSRLFLYCYFVKNSMIAFQNKIIR